VLAQASFAAAHKHSAASDYLILENKKVENKNRTHFFPEKTQTP
jgi:hypothetical protein